MSFFSLWVAARELSLGEGATVEEEEDEDGKWRAEAEEEGGARMAAARDVVWRAVEAWRALDACWRPVEAWLLGSFLWPRAWKKQSI